MAKEKKRYLLPADASKLQLYDGWSQINCKAMNEAVKDGLDPTKTWDCEEVRKYYRAAMPELMKFWREGPWVTPRATEVNTSDVFL